MAEHSPSARTFRFVWQKGGAGRWYVRSVAAESLEEAVTAVHHHLAVKLGLGLADFAVDHYVQEFGTDGQQRALHTLRKKPQVFAVSYCNKTWPPGSSIPDV